MRVSRRFMLFGTASAAILGAAVPGKVKAGSIKIGSDDDTKARLMKMVKTAFPHDFPDVCYARTCDAIFAGANKNAASAIMFTSGMNDLKAAGFDDMDDAAALAHLESIEGSAFFQLMRGTTVTTLYNDHEVWGILGYEGASFDKGGYIDRGFNDLDWLPDPRIDYL